jgi:hypothetical protein
VDLLIELSVLPEKEMILRKLQESRAPPPEMVALQEKMAKLEEWLKASEVDKNIAAADKSRADTMAVLAPIGANTQTMAGEFPVHYREPSFIDQNRMSNAASAQMQQQPQGQPGSQGPGAPQNSGSAGQAGASPPPGQGNPQMQNPMMAQEPPQPGQPGALPLGPGVG